MRIGLIVDGKSEVEAFPLVSAQLRESTGHIMVGPVRAKIHPNARVTAIANVVADSLEYLESSRVDRVVVLFDREDRAECAGQLAEQVRQQIQLLTNAAVSVVIKDRKFENWLVADTAALQAMPARFHINAATLRSIAPNRADLVDAHAVLQACARRRAYHKVQDARRILEHADILRIAANSRSFRRFLRCVGHPVCATQSREPA